jgi:hypothetical protein
LHGNVVPDKQRQIGIDSECPLLRPRRNPLKLLIVPVTEENLLWSIIAGRQTAIFDPPFAEINSLLGRCFVGAV